jgi:putative PIN family toxin of toxin-antitoxin system
MRRVVLDTNVLVSALISPQGYEALVFRLTLSSAFEVGVTSAMLNEYHEVLDRPKFRFSGAKVDALLSQLKTHAKLVHPLHTVEASPDEADNRFLECADAINAEFLITGNKRHFPKAWRNTSIVNAREFLELVVPL